MTKNSDATVETIDEKVGSVIAVIEFVPMTNKWDALIQTLHYVGFHRLGLKLLFGAECWKGLPA
jgi:hypothetical protein